MITERTKAILLLTSYFAKSSDRNLNPLSTGEWNRLVLWLREKKINPEDFLTLDIHSLLLGWQDKSISIERVISLLERKSGLALALEKWVKAGIWIINRGDALYPKNVKDRLKEIAPPILFGIGNIELLNEKYIGVVGSRNINENELQSTRHLGESINNNNYGIVSGGAKGADESAMVGALNTNGYCVGFVSDSLIKKSTSSLYRNYIINKKLCLVSPFNPEAGFNVGNAMARNKLIYTLSDATIVIRSDIKGGTWEGAKENLKKNWVPLWVVDNKEKGNEEVIKLGARRLPVGKELKISELIRVESPSKNELDLFSASINAEQSSNQEKVNSVPESIKKEIGNIKSTKLLFSALNNYKAIIKVVLEKLNSDKKLSYHQIISANLLQRIYINIKAISALFDDFKSNQYFKFPIGLLVRNGLLDSITLMYLTLFIDEDDVKYKEQVTRLNHPLVKESLKEIDEKLKAKIIVEEEAEQLYEIIRTHFRENVIIDSKIRLNKTIKDIFPNTMNTILEKSDLNWFSESYKLYRYYSKYEHFGSISKIMLDFDTEYEFDKLTLSMFYLFSASLLACEIVQVDAESLQEMKQLRDSLVEINPTFKWKE